MDLELGVDSARSPSSADFDVSYDGPLVDSAQIGDEVWIAIAIEAVQRP